MSKQPQNQSQQFPLSLDDFLDGGYIEDFVIGNYECGDHLVMMAVVDPPFITFNGPEVFEIDRHTHVVLFHQTFFEYVGEYIRAAFAGTELEDEADMRVFGTLSQKAIVAFMQWNVINNR